MKKAILLILFFCGMFLLMSNDAKASVFTIHLYYNPSNKNLSFDKLVSEKVSLNKNKSISVFDFSDESNPGNYIAKLYGNNGEELISGFFSAKQGSFFLEIPYISIASSLKIYEKATNSEILFVNVSQFLTCNKNGTCEFEKGENVNTCMIDCASGNVKFSPETKALLDKNGNMIKDQKTGVILLKGNVIEKRTTTENTQSSNNNKMWSIVLIVVMSSIVLVAIYFIVRKKIIQR